MRWTSALLLVLVLCGVSLSGVLGRAEDFAVQPLDEAPPADELSEAIAAQLQPKGLKIEQDGGRIVGEFWFCKSWSAKPDFKPTSDVNYPFEPGQLIGAVRLTRKGNDFRNQSIARGVYTLRYGQQPVDGNHEGTSPTRDFLLLVKAADDESAEKMEAKKLMGAAADAAGSNHPAMLCLKRVQGDVKDAALLHDADKEWWMLQFTGVAAVGGKTQSLPVSLVVVGHADE